jgi:leucyl-tRNA synthetase
MEHTVVAFTFQHHKALIAAGTDFSQNDLPGDLRNLYRLIHRTIKKVTEDIESKFHFNTAIAAIMELFNGLSASIQDESKLEIGTPVIKAGLETIITMLYPFVPHIASELWESLDHRGGLDPLLGRNTPCGARKNSCSLWCKLTGRYDKIALPPVIKKLVRHLGSESQVSRWQRCRRLLRPARLVNIVVEVERVKNGYFSLSGAASRSYPCSVAAINSRGGAIFFPKTSTPYTWNRFSIERGILACNMS